jgi:SAM-dependent methyltransferase
MGFDVAAEAYDRFMGRYSRLLSPRFADFAGVRLGQRVLDVGSGPGALTEELARRVGAARVAAVDPSPPFVDAVRGRIPGVDVQLASAESLPYDDGSFDVALAQLVVHFMPDPVQGIGEMARVTRADGFVAASVWDHASERGPLGSFWRAARALDPGVADESDLPGVREGHLEQLFQAAGLADVRSTALMVSLEHPSFEAWWEPFEAGVGPAGGYVRSLDDERRAALRERCRNDLPAGPFTVDARAWAAVGRRT